MGPPPSPYVARLFCRSAGQKGKASLRIESLLDSAVLVDLSLSLFIFDVYIPGGLSGSVGARASGSKTNVLDVVQQSTRGGGEEQTWKLCHI